METRIKDLLIVLSEKRISKARNGSMKFLLSIMSRSNLFVDGGYSNSVSNFVGE